jgi:hypothetical protein
MALVTKNFSDIITFTRASTATFFNSAGVLVSAAADAPRFDYNPSTLAARGLLIEEARTNLITSSAALPAGTNATVTPDTYVALDGTTTGDTIVDDTANTEHYSDSSFTPTAATTYTFSAYIKNIGASSSNYAVVRMAGDFAAYVFVQLSDMTVALAGGAGLVANSASVTPANNGWYRVTVSGLSTGTVASVARIQVAQSLALSAYVGTGVGFAVWGRQLEVGAFPTSYIPTTGTSLTRAADVASVNTLSPWYNASSGTIYAEYSIPFAIAPSANGSLASFIGASGILTNGIGAFVSQSSTKNGSFNVWSSGTNVGRIDASPSFVAGATVKYAAAYAANNRAVTANGTTPTTSATAYTIPTVTTLSLGNDTVGILNGYLRRITYYPRRLSNAELQAITA